VREWGASSALCPEMQGTTDSCNWHGVMAVQEWCTTTAEACRTVQPPWWLVRAQATRCIEMGLVIRARVLVDTVWTELTQSTRYATLGHSTANADTGSRSNSAQDTIA
jgi:hypothetical protein